MEPVAGSAADNMAIGTDMPERSAGRQMPERMAPSCSDGIVGWRGRRGAMVPLE